MKKCQKMEMIKEMYGIKGILEEFGPVIARKLFEEEMVEKNNPLLSLEFARTVEGADIIKHGNIVIESNNPEINYDYSVDVIGADKEKHGEIIAKSKHAVYSFLYACREEVEDIMPYMKNLVEAQRYDLIEDLAKEKARIKVKQKNK